MGMLISNELIVRIGPYTTVLLKSQDTFNASQGQSARTPSEPALITDYHPVALTQPKTEE